MRRRCRCQPTGQENLPRCTFTRVVSVAVILSISLVVCQLAQGQGSDRGASRGSRPLATESIDTNTRWVFRVPAKVELRSPIVRLGDVVQPVDPNMAGWKRLRNAPIGLLPVGNRSMVVQRERLERVILEAEATPLAIDWVGPSEIHVSRVPETSGVRQASFTDSRSSQSQTDVAFASNRRRTTEDAGYQLSEHQSRRITHWVTLGIKRAYPEVEEAYRIEIPLDQEGITEWGSITTVPQVDAIDPFSSGLCRMRMEWRSLEGAVKSKLLVRLHPHPRVMVASRTLPRGHRITAADLVEKPIREEEFQDGFVIDADQAIGKEVRGSLRIGKPIRLSDFGSPMLVERGDLIEVRVVGGGVTVTTNAKSLGAGAAAELVEVETLTPRKRLIARVVQPGLVEIVTRAPQVKP